MTGALSRETWGAPGTYSQLDGLAVSASPVIHSLPLHQGTQAHACALAQTSKLTSSPYMNSRIGRKTETWLTQTAASCILRSRRGRSSLCHTDPTCQSSSLLPTPDSIPIGRLAYPEKGSTTYKNSQADGRIRRWLELAKTARSGEERRDGHVAQPVEDLCPLNNPSCGAMADCERGLSLPVPLACVRMKPLISLPKAERDNPEGGTRQLANTQDSFCPECRDYVSRLVYKRDRHSYCILSRLYDAI